MSTPADSPDQGGLATLDRELEELIREETIEPGDHERFSHYVKKEKILESAITGKPVRALRLPPDSALVAILRGGRVIAPQGDEGLEPGDELLFVATTAVEEEIRAALGH